MKNLILILSISALQILALSSPAFARAPTAHEKAELLKILLADKVVHAAYEQQIKAHEDCKAVLTKAISNGGWELEAEIDCHKPDTDEVGGGSTLIKVSGYYYGEPSYKAGSDVFIDMLTINIQNFG